MGKTTNRAQWILDHNGSRVPYNDDGDDNVEAYGSLSAMTDGSAYEPNISFNKAVDEYLRVNGIVTSGWYTKNHTFPFLYTKINGHKDVLWGLEGDAQNTTPTNQGGSSGFPTATCINSGVVEVIPTDIYVQEATVDGAYDKDGVWHAGVKEFHSLALAAILNHKYPYKIKVRGEIDASLSIAIGGKQGFIAVANHAGVYYQPTSSDPKISVDVDVNVGNTFGKGLVSDYSTVADTEHTVKCFVIGIPSAAGIVTAFSDTKITGRSNGTYPIYEDNATFIETSQPIILDLDAVHTCVGVSYSGNHALRRATVASGSSIIQKWNQDKDKEDNILHTVCRVLWSDLETFSLPCKTLVDGVGDNDLFSGGGFGTCSGANAQCGIGYSKENVYEVEYVDETYARLRRKFDIGVDVHNDEFALWMGFTPD